MSEGLYRLLFWTAVVVGVFVVGASVHEYLSGARNPGDLAYLDANTLFEDGEYARALALYDEALAADPNHIHALRGRARSLMQLGRFDEAMVVFDDAIEREPDFGATYANRGILKDRMGRYREAIADYERALALDAELADGPHWMTRFLRNQPHKPPGIAERAEYLRAELAKPEGRRLLSVPQLDAEQRSYKQ